MRLEYYRAALEGYKVGRQGGAAAGAQRAGGLARFSTDACACASRSAMDIYCWASSRTGRAPDLPACARLPPPA